MFVRYLSRQLTSRDDARGLTPSCRRGSGAADEGVQDGMREDSTQRGSARTRGTRQCARGPRHDARDDTICGATGHTRGSGRGNGAVRKGAQDGKREDSMQRGGTCTRGGARGGTRGARPDTRDDAICGTTDRVRGSGRGSGAAIPLYLTKFN
jgi:hypothetical protein